MGRGKRIVPVHLPNKLLQIRQALNLNFEEMADTLQNNIQLEIKIYRNHILEYEKGKREPQLPILLAYGRLANVYVDVLLDDNLTLSDKIPVKRK